MLLGRRVRFAAAGLLALSLGAGASPALAAWYDVDTYVSLSAPAQIQQSQEIPLTAQYGNQGPYVDPNETLVVDYPSNATVDTNLLDRRCAVGAPYSVVCSLGYISPGSTGSLTLYFHPTSTGEYDFTAQISSSSDPTPADNAATESVQVVADYSADMFATFGGPGPAGPRVALTDGPEDLNVGNNGPLDAQNVEITDTISGPAHFDGAQSGCSFTLKTLTCDYPTWGARAVGFIYVSVYYEDAGTVSETVSVSSSTPDADPSNNQQSASFSIVRQAELKTAISAAPNPVVAGKKVMVTATVTNTGPSTASSVAYTESWSPSGAGAASSKSITSSQGSCSTLSSGSVSCSLGAIPAGASATVTVELVTGKPGTETVTAGATAPEYDPTPDDNTASVTIGVTGG